MEPNVLITQLYVGYYNRAPDPEGLNYWIGRYKAGVSLADIANSFAASPEAISTYPYLAFPNVSTAETFLEQVYQNLFNRSIDADGRAYYANKLATGQTTPGQIIAEIQANANTNTNNTDGQVLANKVTVGLDFALEAASTPGFKYEGAAVNQANTILDSVTSTQASVDAALASNDAFFGEDGAGTPGDTFTLTTGIDAGDKFTGGTGNDTFIGDKNTTSAADQVNGGAGNDTLQLFGTVTLPTISGVENVQFNGVTAGTVNLAGNADVTNVAFQNADLTAAIDATVSGTQTVSLSGITDSTNTDADVDVKAAASVTAQTIKLSGVGDVATGGNEVDIDINGTGVATLNVDSSSKASRIDLENAGGALKTLNVSGNAKLTVDANVPGATTITSTNTAGLTASTAVATGTAAGLAITTAAGADVITLAQAAGANALSSKVAVDLGAGNDTLSITNLTAATDIQAGASLKGGEGTDTLNVAAGAVLNATTGKQFSGFEVLGLNGSSGTIDVGVLASTNTIGSAVVGAALGGNATINNLAEGATVVFNASTGLNTLTVNQKDAGAGSPDDVINAIIDGKAAITVANVDFNDIETVNVSATSAGTNITHIASVLAADEATKVTVNASTAALTITDLEADSLVLFDASASAKSVSVTTGAEAFEATAGVAFKGGAGADTFDFTNATTAAGAVTALDFVVTGGAGADSITLAAAAGGVDRVVYTAQADSTATKFDSITNFDATAASAQDKIDVSAFGFTGNAVNGVKTIAAGVSVVAGEVVVSDAAKANFFVDGGLGRGVAAFDNGADVLVFVDANKDGNFSADADLVINLVGVANATDIDTADFTFA